MSNNYSTVSNNTNNNTNAKSELTEGNKQNLTVEQKPDSLITRIQRRKQLMFSWPMQKKLLKLAVYLECQVNFFLISSYFGFDKMYVTFYIFLGRIL